MNLPMISFFVSGLAILGMISLKSREIKTNKRSWLSTFTDRTDGRMSAMYLFIRKAISYINRQSAIALIQWIAYHILSWIRSCYIWMRSTAHSYPHSKKVLDMVRGKGTTDRNGGASVYLKKISKEKE